MTIACGTWKQRAGLLAVVGFIALRIWSRWERSGDYGDPLSLYLIGIFLAGATLVWITRYWGTASVDATGVTRKGAFGTTSIPWHDVRQVEESRTWRALVVRGSRGRVRVPMEAPGYGDFHRAVHAAYAEHMGDALRPTLPVATAPALQFWIVVFFFTPLLGWVGWTAAEGASLEVRAAAVVPGLLIGLVIASLHPVTLKADREGLTARWLFKRRHWSAEDVTEVELASSAPGARGRMAMVGLVVSFRAGKPLKLDQRWVTVGLGDLAYALRRGWGLEIEEAAGGTAAPEPAPQPALRP